MSGLSRLRAVVAWCGSQERAAKQLGLSQRHVEYLLAERKAFGPKTLRALGVDVRRKDATELRRRKTKLKDLLPKGSPHKPHYVLEGSRYRWLDPADVKDAMIIVQAQRRPALLRRRVSSKTRPVAPWLLRKAA